MVPEIWSVMDRIFCHFELFLAFLPLKNQQPKKSKFWKNEKTFWIYYHFTDPYHKCQSYDVWFLRYEAWWTERFVIFAILQPEKSKFSKTEKNAWWYYHFISVYHKCFNHLKYQVRRTEFFVILDHFLSIYPLNSWKIKILKKWKKCLEILSFYNSVPKIRIICYAVPEMWHMMNVIVIFHFGLFFAL